MVNKLFSKERTVVQQEAAATAGYALILIRPPRVNEYSKATPD